MATLVTQSTKANLLNLYKTDLPKYWDDEKYKWEAVKHFQENWDIDAEDFGAMFMEATKRHLNLLASGMYYPQGMIQEFANADRERTRAMFRNLFDETKDLKERIQEFIAEAEAIRSSHGAEWKNHFQDLHAISVYLTFRYPERYFIYKYTELKNFVSSFGDNFAVRRASNPEYLVGAFNYIEAIRTMLAADNELKNAIAKLTDDNNCYADAHMNITTVDFIYYIGKRLLDKPTPIVPEETEPDSTEPTRRYWIYAPGEGAYKWDFCLENDLICIGWEEMGDVSQIASREEIRQKMKEVYAEDKTYTNSSLAIWDFSHVMKPGDVVYAKLGNAKIIGRGIVTGNYYYDDTLEKYNHARTIKWTHEGLWEAPWGLPLKTLTEISADSANDIENVLGEERTDVVEEPATLPKGGKQYWWLVASPKIWRLSDMRVGDVQDYTLYNDNGNRRRIFQNFLNAQVGDIVIGYEATPTKQIVALLEVVRANDGQTILFRKTESLPVPIDFAKFKDNPELAELEFLRNPNGSFYKVTEDEYNALMDIIREENPINAEEQIPAYTKEDFLNEVFIGDTDYDRLRSLLLTKKNIILQGAPGVGKTFSAKRLAYSIMGQKDEKRVELVQFHQSYTYEDFIMGYKPNEDGGFYLKKGVFYNFCKKAKADPSQPYFFIIDEINRANLSKIFGELLMLIENDYRDTTIKLAYSDELFDVPGNVHIIGMMNTADRSLAMIDYALRRRFSFFDMQPGFDSEGFKMYQAQIGDSLFDKAIDAIINLNKVIASDASLGKGFCIGHSYFCNCKEFSRSWLENVIHYDVLPMLREYWFDNDEQYNAQSTILVNLLK